VYEIGSSRKLWDPGGVGSKQIAKKKHHGLPTSSTDKRSQLALEGAGAISVEESEERPHVEYAADDGGSSEMRGLQYGGKGESTGNRDVKEDRRRLLLQGGASASDYRVKAISRKSTKTARPLYDDCLAERQDTTFYQTYNLAQKERQEKFEVN